MFHHTALALPFAALYGIMVYSGWKVLAYPSRRPLRDDRRLNNRGLW